MKITRDWCPILNSYRRQIVHFWPLLEVTILLCYLFFLAGCKLSSPQFKLTVIDPAATSPEKPYGKAIGDINGDGFPDLFISSAQNGGMHWYEYPDWTKIAVRDTGSWSEDCLLVDIDLDGDIDIVNGNKSGLFWYENPSNSIDSSWREIFIGSDGTNIHDLVVSDFNGDQLPDVAARYEKEYQRPVSIFFQVTPSQWQAFSKTHASFRKGEGLATGDLDRDGDTDLVIGHIWLENQQSGSVWIEHQYAENLPEQLIIFLADLDQNGNPDILTSPQSSQPGNLCWYTASKDVHSMWTVHHILENTSHMHGLAVADFNQDGNPDIHTAIRHDNPGDHDPISVWISDGSSTPSFTEYVLAISGSHFTKVGDIDLDGDPDIFGANWMSKVGGVDIELWRNRQSSK